MNDKTLLELAAKAAGYSTSKYWHNDGIHCSTEYAYTDGAHGWNPLTDDGDALRLAVKLKMLVNVMTKGVQVDIENIEDAALESIESDPYAATRRAITRAAAEIGKGE